MASSVNSGNYYVVVALLLLSICISSGLVCSPAKADLIDDVCSLSNDVQYCSETIRTAAGSNTTDLADLGSIVLGLATSKVPATQALIRLLYNDANDPNLRDTLNSCLGSYDDCGKVLKDCHDLLGKKDYVGLGHRLGDAQDGPDGCDQSFSDFQPALPEPGELKQASSNLQVLIATVGVIATKLDGGGIH
ncbi:uncharacterized protein [Coffea arabica]|uniref:Pectinesterase inhibitor domain-containing protein n=1 Tax=Coffea arabica TaxID=13443 RepID=A0A6P6V398_COFAR|nr:uncharacterized protein LOC113717085 [Coffea arabica]